MSRAPGNLDEALRAVAAGDLDALQPDQVARLEAILNEEPSVAARLADHVPAVDARLARVLARVEQGVTPGMAAWERAWERIDAVAPAAVARVDAVRRRALVLRLWKPLAAVAACLVMAALWRAGSPRPREEWPMQLATDVEINALEVSDGATPFVISDGGEHAVQIIWVVEDQS